MMGSHFADLLVSILFLPCLKYRNYRVTQLLFNQAPLSLKCGLIDGTINSGRHVQSNDYDRQLNQFQSFADKSSNESSSKFS